MALTSRERVLCSLNHEEPDRVPLFIGTSGATTVLGPGYERLKAQMGVQSSERWISKTLQYALMDEEVLLRLGSDGRAVFPGPAASSLRKEISSHCIVDDWGVVWKREPGCLYFETTPPLKDVTLEDLASYPWPDLVAPARFEGLADRARAIQQSGYASVLVSGVTIFEQAYILRGVEQFLSDLVLDEEFFTALITKLKEMMVTYVRELLRHVGPYVDVFITGDDLGTQESLLMSPQAYRRLVKPHHAELLAEIHRGTPAKVFFHSDGNIYSIIGDLIDVGVDLLNPVQVSAGDMGDTARLKRQFGRRMAFCGAIDTQHVLPHGTIAEVQAEVRRRIRDLAPGGGYIAASVHCIQSDVPPENILAMCEEVLRAGQYPIRC